MHIPGANLRELRYQFETVEPEHEQVVLEELCEGFVRANHAQIVAAPDLFPCCLGCGGIKYRDPKPCVSGRKKLYFCQPVLGAGPLMEAGQETCIGLACLLAAIKRNAGDARARVAIVEQFDEVGRVIPGLWHAVVIDGRGQTHDPQELAESGGCGGDCGCGK